MSGYMYKSNSPQVSIVVCCYNASLTVERTLKSLSAQSFEDIEIILIDDGSSDNTVNLLESFASIDPRAKLLKNISNRGTAYSRQRGLENASCEFVMFIDSDDIADPELVSRLYDTISKDSAIIGVGCYTKYFINEDKDIGIQRLGPSSKQEFEKIYNESKLLFTVPCTIFRKSDAIKVGGYRLDILPNDEGIRYEDFSEDLDLWCRMSDLGADGRYFITLPISLLHYRKPINSLSTRNVKFMQLKMRWIKDSLQRRRAGLSERTLKQFINSRKFLEKLNDWRSDKAAIFYKKAGFSFAERNYLTLIWFVLLAGLMSPKLIRQKIMMQRIL